ncbi:MAG TPA: AAA family ATPase [Candidatus Paceibacterota bacterium]|nr:AAA family ATPase [Candidatus Paceibacterota bacterium]
MRLKNLEINGFKSFAKKTNLEFQSPVVCIVGPNGSGKSNVVESLRFVLGEQSMKSMRGKAGTDLVFKGSKNLPKASRASVTIHLDNRDKIFKMTNEAGESVDLNYDTISISREVYADGVNKYMLNGSEVRLKDINNLLASVSIGSSGHHIISQGEADRILNASSRERREMIEDALGLKIYQYKIREAERKLARTGENMKEISMLRREIIPHLNFLKKQVEKFEKAKEMKINLVSLYHEYLKKENFYLETEKKNLAVEKDGLLTEIAGITALISEEKDSEEKKENNQEREELKRLEEKISQIRIAKSEIERRLGRIEGMIEMEESRSSVQEIKTETEENPRILVEREEFDSFFKEANEYLEEAMYMDVLENIAPLLGKIKDILDRFAKNFERKNSSNSAMSSSKPETTSSSNLEELKNTQKEILAQMQEIQDEEIKISETIAILKNKMAISLELERNKEREKFNLRVKNQELNSALQMVSVREENLNKENEAFENELREGNVLVGADILGYKNFEITDQFDRFSQEELRRKIERIKIKLEDAGAGGGSEVLKEYQEISSREQFLSKEMEDLSLSMESLKKLMTDLKAKIDEEFKRGIEKINIEFKEFFALMFNGGTGSLAVTTETKKKKIEISEDGEEQVVEDEDEEEVPEQGIEINVSLPHKKVKELNALSGGERSLTSIALLFAMSQVNPPPFLVLDETDAALDEANSRKYGDMIEKLSKHSQLIVVTHNRETMSRAGVLYGVTVGADGASKLLSVKFEEATAIAK